MFVWTSGAGLRHRRLIPIRDEILGVWKTFDKQGKLESTIEIYKEQNEYCAKIASLTEPNWPADDNQGMAGKAKNDRHNPNADLRGRPIVGMQIMHGFIYNLDKNVWENGRVYDPGCARPTSANLHWSPQTGSKFAVTLAFRFWDEPKLGRDDQTSDLPSSANSNSKDFLFLVREMRVNLGDILVGEFLNFFLGAFLIFFTGLAGLDGFFQKFHRVAAHMAHSYAGILGHAMRDLHKS